MAKELRRNEFYFIDFVPAGSSYEKHRQEQSCPDNVVNFAESVFAHISEEERELTKPDRLYFSRELAKVGGFLVGWGKGRKLMKLITIQDLNSYIVQGFGFEHEQDATAFILKWS